MIFDKSSMRQYIALALILVGVALTVFFGLHAFRGVLRVQFRGLERGTTDPEKIRGWMTISYIARIYETPEEYLFKETGIPSDNNRKRSLRELNRRYIPDERSEIVNRIRRAIRKYQKKHKQKEDDNV